MAFQTTTPKPLPFSAGLPTDPEADFAVLHAWQARRVEMRMQRTVASLDCPGEPNDSVGLLATVYRADARSAIRDPKRRVAWDPSLSAKAGSFPRRPS